MKLKSGSISDTSPKLHILVQINGVKAYAVADRLSHLDEHFVEILRMKLPRNTKTAGLAVKDHTTKIFGG